jgi:hypothetical protein
VLVCKGRLLGDIVCLSAALLIPARGAATNEWLYGRLGAKGDVPGLMPTTSSSGCRWKVAFFSLASRMAHACIVHPIVPAAGNYPVSHSC